MPNGDGSGGVNSSDLTTNGKGIMSLTCQTMNTVTIVVVAVIIVTDT